MRSVEEIMADLDSVAARNDSSLTEPLILELQTIGTPQAEAVALRWLGITSWKEGAYATALEQFGQALDLMVELNDRVGAAGVTGNIGMIYRSLGDYARAVVYYHQALEVQEELGDRKSAARVMVGLGNVFMLTGDYPKALQYYHRALEIQEELGDRPAAAHTVGNLGAVFMSTGDYPQALEQYRRALTMHEEVGDQTGAANVTTNIGIVCMATADYPQALAHLRRGLQLHEAVGNRIGMATALSNLGNVYQKTGDLLQALEYVQQAITLHEELGNHDGAGIALGNKVSLLLKMHRDEEADALLQKQASMVLNRPAARAEYHANRAVCSERQGDTDEAWTQLQTALQIVTEAGDRDHVGQCHEKLRDLAKRRNDFEGYVEHNDAYMRITEEVRGAKSTRRLAMIEAERHIEAERQVHAKERALLYGALPEHIATRMLAGKTIEDHFEHAAVLFTDITGFTTHTSSMHPSETIKLLEDLYNTFDAICAEHGVTKVKTIGDSYLCFANEGNGESGMGKGAVERIAAVALAMQNAEFYWPTATASSNSNRIQLRIGIHSGPVSAGVIGTQRLQYDIWGDTVNVASRMESTGEPGRIQCSEAFVGSLTSFRDDATSRHPDGGEADEGPRANTEPWNYRTVERGTVEVKGKGSMTTYWLEEA